MAQLEVVLEDFLGLAVQHDAALDQHLAPGGLLQLLGVVTLAQW